MAEVAGGHVAALEGEVVPEGREIEQDIGVAEKENAGGSGEGEEQPESGGRALAADEETGGSRR
ncbi:MAG: hypothetical protein HOC74_00685 [Gemmatimonadetes bacterium]|nr:hypothetical protein [Gemmatimonadota bacterium]